MSYHRTPVDDRKKDMLENFVQEVLNRKFPNEPIKRVIDVSEANKINFACPFCGDSQKKASKKRGNMFLETSTYKCFNDGCNTWMPIRKFVSTFVKKFGLQIDLDMFGSEIDAEPPIKAVQFHANPLINFLLMPKENLVSMEDILNRFNLIRVDELPADSVVRNAIETRFIHHTPDYGDFFYADTRDDKFYIFNVGSRSGKILGFAVRSLRADWDGPKYIIKNYVDLKAAYPDKHIDATLETTCNTFNNYFNILNLNFAHTITIVEGQVDSRFLYNCLSTTGVSKSLSIIGSLGPKKNVRILFDRDKAGKKEMIKLIEQGYSVFLWNPLIEALKNKWHTTDDIKALSLDKLKDVNDLYKFLALRQDVDFTIFNEFINGFFSTSIYDIMAI